MQNHIDSMCMCVYICLVYMCVCVCVCVCVRVCMNNSDFECHPMCCVGEAQIIAESRYHWFSGVYADKLGSVT